MTMMLKILTVLTAMLAVSYGKVDPKKHILREITKTLGHMTQDKIECGATLIPDVFSDTKGQSASEIFCKAAEALVKIPPCESIKRHLKALRLNLAKEGEQTLSCPVNKFSEIELTTFLRKLRKLSQQKYRQ
ncbi:interleukin-4-like [Callorhinchus milii]|uniref:interleukin-4-like n=1 Tax=Callorhinchus milii TaxID=7868 RepID=UPI0004575944|nr:interleukin-4-like [Callorhinchus milii]|eukprot:gi/632967897/ref/XP_007900235.1/ PREDICTED: interleukin-4-like [Callorhinchus milii]